MSLGNEDQIVRIRGELPSDPKHKLTKLLGRYADMLAWKPENMIGIPRSIIEHRLNANPSFPPIK